MRKWGNLLVIGLLFLCCRGVQAEEMKAESRIVSVGLFKNGLAVVCQEIEVKGDGTYIVDDIPRPVHGTYWVESDALVETRVTRREVDQPLSGERAFDMQKALAGRMVTVYFKDPKAPEVRGKVMDIGAGDRDMNWNRTYQQPQHNYWYGYNQPANTAIPAGPRYLLLQSDRGNQGLVYLDLSTTRSIMVDKDRNMTMKTMKPVMLFTTTETKKEKNMIRISYLTKGISWAPSYLVNMIGPDELEFFQKAVIRNELLNLEDVEIQLISGFPNIPLQHVDSPLSPETSWANFFKQLSTRFQSNQSSNMSILSQNAVAPGIGSSGRPGPMPEDITGDSSDIYYHSIGERTMLEGDSVALETARARTGYDRIVEWKIPDTRQANGRYVEDWHRQQNPEKYKSTAWDAVRFRNPLEFPMTTGAAVIHDNGKFHGQTRSYWTNPGQKNVLKITKALSIETRAVESEIEGQREIVTYGGKTFRKVKVKGEIDVTNRRGKPVTILIKRHFSGNLLEADGEPECRLLEEGVIYVNKRNALVWEIELKPGETRNLTYKYDVLVYH